MNLSGARWFPPVVTAIACCVAGCSDSSTPNQPPSCTINNPLSGETFLFGEAIQFQGSCTDPETGPLAGSALTWASNNDGNLGTGTSFSRTNLSVGSHTITLTGTDSEGANGSASVSITVLPNQPPVASIAEPSDGSSFIETLSVAFSGSATDPEDGPLSGNALAWTSSLDGNIGTGASFSTTDLSVGAHDVTLTATDSRGEVGTAAVTVIILPSLTGNWAGQDTLGYTWELLLVEDVAAGTISGQAQIVLGEIIVLPDGTVSGEVSGSAISLTLTFPEYDSILLTGTVSEDRNTITAVLNQSGFVDEPLTLQRAGAASSGELLASPVAVPGTRSVADLLRSLSGKGGSSPDR